MCEMSTRCRGHDLGPADEPPASYPVSVWIEALDIEEPEVIAWLILFLEDSEKHQPAFPGNETPMQSFVGGGQFPERLHTSAYARKCLATPPNFVQHSLARE